VNTCVSENRVSHDDCSLTELEKFNQQQWHQPRDKALAQLRQKAAEHCRRYAQQPTAGHQKKVWQLFAARGPRIWLDAGFSCDYGCNIHLGDNVYLNQDVLLQDVAPIRIGDNVLIGPGTHIYTAEHPLDPIERRSGLTRGKPVVIEEDAWIGGHVTVLPGVTIGRGAIIGAGAVVTSDIAPGHKAVGNPARATSL